MEGLRGYVPQAYYVTTTTPNGAPQQQYAYVMNGQVSGNCASKRRTVVMTKLPGERSFGMTLEQQLQFAATDYPRVSFVFPDSAAFRAGIQSGWAIEVINGASSIGRTVSDIATVFRNLTQVTLYVDTSAEVPAAVPQLPPTAAPTASALTRQQFPPPLPPPQSYFPVRGATFASLIPSNIPTMAGFASTGATAMTAVPASVPTAPTLSVPQSSGAVASVQAYATATTPPLPAQVTPEMSISQLVHTAALQSSAAVASRVAPAPAPLSSPAVSTTPPAVSTVASSAVPAVAARPPTQRQAATGLPSASTAPEVSVVVASPPVARPTSKVAPPSLAPPPAPRPQQAPRPAAATMPLLPVRIAHESAFTMAAIAPSPPRLTTVTGTPAPARSTSNAPMSSASPSSSSVAAAAAVTPTSTGKRRRRSTVAEATPPTAPAATGRRRRRAAKRRTSEVPDVWESDDAVYFYASDDDVEVVESPQPSAANSGSRRSARQSESGGRSRRSLTVARLMTMGFTEEDAQASVEACGQDPDKCMLWIVAHIEEKQFLNDLNKASIESEQQKLLDAQEQKKQESETLRHATVFTSLFPSSYILSTSAEATRLHEMLSSTIGEIAADTLMRSLMTKLLTVESKAIRWYKEAAKCYMLQLAERLEIAYTAHDAVTCCAKLMATEPASHGCSFVRALHEEEQALTKALFSMPENHGGVPLAFLRADESMQFSLDDDGFEVLEAPASPSSPGHE